MTIRLRLTIIFLALVSIPVLFVGLITLSNYQNSIQKSRLLQLGDLATFKAERIEAYFAQLKDGMELAQTFYNIRKNLPELTKLENKRDDPGAVAARKILDLQMAKSQKVLKLTDIMLANNDGTIVYVSNLSHSAIDYLKNIADLWPAISSAKKDSIFFLSDIFLNKLEHNRPEMLAMAPVIDLSGAPAGTIVFEIDMGPLYSLIQDTVGLGSSGEVLICKQAGSEVIYLNPLRHDPGSALTRRVSFSNTIAIPAKKALMGESGVGRSVDYRGKDVIAAWRNIPSLGWGLVAKIDSREAFAVAINLRNSVLLILFVALAMSGIITFIVTQSISRPIRALSEGAEIIGHGNLNHKVGTALKDEIGQLSREFDKMTSALKITMASRNELNREIIERKKAEKELVRSNKDLEQFAYVASHDLQEPLRAVAGFVGILKNHLGPALDEKANEYIGYSIEGAERMQTLIEDLLKFSRVGTKGGAFVQMPLKEAVDGAVRYLSAAISESGVQVIYNDLPVVNADLPQMTQLLQNLIGNAIKFHSERQPEVRISAVRKDEGWEIRISDNGIGIEPQYYERIFLIFQRLHTRSEYKGTGIGLAICKKIVERHGGTIGVESKFGQGSTFYFTLPDRRVQV